MRKAIVKMNNKMGFVYLVGAGPGDASYITIKGMEVLQQCDVVIYDRLASPELLLHTKSDCRKIYVGKKPGAHAMKQEAINKIIVQEALKGQLVVRLKGGDPFVFGRGGEEILALEEHHIGYEVIPGITSAIAVPMSAGVPVTHRGVSRSFHVITGHTATGEDNLTDNYEALAKTGGTLVFLMGLAHLESIVNRLMSEGMTADTPVMIVEQGTTVYQRSVRGTLGTIVTVVKAEKLQSPVVIVIGEVARLEMLPTIRKVGITGTISFIKHVKHAIMEKEIAGVQNRLYAYPYVDIKPSNNEEVSITLSQLEQFQWIVFTSANGVRCFFDALRRLHIDRRILQDKAFAVIGEGTAKVLEDYGYYADFIPSSYYAEVLGKELAEKISEEDKASRVLIARAMGGSVKLTDAFQEKDIIYKDLAIYETDVRQDVVELAVEQIRCLDVIMFASASGVRLLLEAVDEEMRKTLFDGVDVFCIGKETAAELNRYGIKEYKIAEHATAEGLAELLRRKDKNRNDEEN